MLCLIILIEQVFLLLSSELQTLTSVTLIHLTVTLKEKNTQLCIVAQWNEERFLPDTFLWCNEGITSITNTLQMAV